MLNFLEQLVAEWYEHEDYFVRRNVKVGKRKKGGYDGELDVVAFKPTENRLLHIETSMDSDSWERRQERFGKKFQAGETHIRSLFKGFGELPKIEPVALFVYGSNVKHPKIGGGRVRMIQEFMDEIRKGLEGKRVDRAAIPEQFVILRSLQFAANYWR